MSVHGSHPRDDPNGIVLQLWNHGGRIDLTEPELTEVEDHLRWIRRRLAAGGPVPFEKSPVPSGVRVDEDLVERAEALARDPKVPRIVRAFAEECAAALRGTGSDG